MKILIRLEDGTKMTTEEYIMYRRYIKKIKNKNMRIKAKFIGEDSSLGYRNSRVYRLVKAKTPNGHIVISKVDGLGYCPYTSEKTFKENWELIDKD